MRWIVCVRSFHPLELYVCNVFWARVANKSSAVPLAAAASAAASAAAASAAAASAAAACRAEEEPAIWEDRERAYPAMWVLEGVKQEETLPDYQEVIAGLEELYPTLRWNEIQESIHKLLREGGVLWFECSSTKWNAVSSCPCIVWL
jgi:hypothetical protein